MNRRFHTHPEALLTSMRSSQRRTPRYYVFTEDKEDTLSLKAATLDDAVEEARGLNPETVGQITDVYQRGQTDPVAVSIDVEGW